MVVLLPSEVVRPNSNGQFCSTWGNHHYRTFDGDFFQLPFTCTYILTAHCKADYESFNIQLQRQQSGDDVHIQRVSMKLDGTVVEMTKTAVLINNKK